MRSIGTLVAATTLAISAVVLASQAGGNPQAPNPRQQPGAAMHIYAPDQHDLYDGGSSSPPAAST